MSRCGFCKGELTFENMEEKKRGFGFLKQEIMYVCPHCKSVIGVSRGKWTG